MATMSLAITAAAGAAADQHPSPYVDEGACPFECCTYREWKVEHDSELRSAPEHRATVVGKVRSGETVQALTGNVVTTPARFRVKRDHAGYLQGESFWVYTYLGEGLFRIWRDGAMQEEQLDFSPYGGTGGDRCQDSDEWCWGELDEPLKMRWWIKLRDRQNVEGWTDEHENFSGADACG